MTICSLIIIIVSAFGTFKPNHSCCRHRFNQQNQQPAKLQQNGAPPWCIIIIIIVIIMIITRRAIHLTGWLNSPHGSLRLVSLHGAPQWATNVQRFSPRAPFPKPVLRKCIQVSPGPKLPAFVVVEEEQQHCGPIRVSKHKHKQKQRNRDRESAHLIGALHQRSSRVCVFYSINTIYLHSIEYIKCLVRVFHRSSFLWMLHWIYGLVGYEFGCCWICCARRFICRRDHQDIRLCVCHLALYDIACAIALCCNELRVVCVAR